MQQRRLPLFLLFVKGRNIDAPTANAFPQNQHSAALRALAFAHISPRHMNKSGCLGAGLRVLL
jgi:hypothetical protein